MQSFRQKDFHVFIFSHGDIHHILRRSNDFLLPPDLTRWSYFFSNLIFKLHSTPLMH